MGAPPVFWFFDMGHFRVPPHILTSGISGLNSEDLQRHTILASISKGVSAVGNRYDIYSTQTKLQKAFARSWFFVGISTKIKGNHHVQGNAQVYNVRIPGSLWAL